MNLFFYHYFLLGWNESKRKYKSPVEVSFPVHRSTMMQCLKRKYNVRHGQTEHWNQFCPEDIISAFSFWRGEIAS